MKSLQLLISPIAETDTNTSWWVDAQKAGNEFRFMNHYYGSQPESEGKARPNVELRWDAQTQTVQVWTLLRIKKDEELVVDYGPDYGLPRETEDEPW